MKSRSIAPNLLVAVLVAVLLCALCPLGSAFGQTAIPISCGQSVTSTTLSATTNVFYTFSGTAGEILKFAFWANPSGGTMDADIYGPPPTSQHLASLSGGAGVDTYGGSALVLSLTNTGSFTIAVHDSGYVHANTYSLSVQSVLAGGCSTLGSIVCGQPPLANATAFKTQMDAWSYSGSSGQILKFAFWATPGSGTMTAEIYNPGGQLLTSLNGGSGVDGYGGSTVTLTLTNSGSFTVLVHDSDYAATNNYFLSVQSPTGGGCDALGSIVCGQPPVANATAFKTQMDAWSYSGSSGQILKFAFWATPGSGTMTAEIYNPGGQLLTSLNGGSGVDGYGGSTVTLTLTNSGSFTVLVHDSDYAATNNYFLSVQSPTGGGCDALGSIVCGQPPVANATAFKTQMDAWSYSGNSGQILKFAFWATPGSGTMTAEIYNPGGQLLSSLNGGSGVDGSGGSTVTLTLTNGGTFTVLVHDSDYAATNNYFLSVQSPTGGGCESTPLACGQTVNSNITGIAQNVAYAFGTGGGTVTFSFSGSSYSGARFDLYDPTGNLVFAGTPGTGPTTNLAAGVYTLLVHDSDYAGTGSYGFTVNCFPGICNYLISPTGPISVPVSGTNGTIAITVGSGCPWTNWVSTNGSGWLTITCGSSGSGNGVVCYSVAQNCSPSQRSGTLTIAGYTVTVIQAGPVTFAGQDIGDPGAPGGFTYTNCGTYLVSGSGEGTDGTADVFYFLSEPLTGDGQIIARFLGLQGGNPASAEAGIMMRQTMDPGSAQVSFSLSARTNAIFRRRLVADNPGMQSSFAASSLVHGTNYLWLRLMRMGSTFIGYYSTNGLNWQYMWFTTLSMTNPVQVGFAVTAHNFGDLATATFDNVTAGGLTVLSGPLPQPGPVLLLGGQPWTHAECQRVGGFEFLLTGTIGDYFNLKSSSNAAAPFSLWPSLGTVTNVYGVVPVLDAQALTNNHRFYNALKLGGP